MGKSRTVLSPEEFTQKLALLPDWRVVDQKKLTRNYSFPDFQKALDFVNRVGIIAEEQGHHPDLRLGWGFVEVETWTHDAGGLTEQDFLLASKIDRLS